MEIYEHGNTHNDEEKLNEKYPFMLCPECMSEKTRIVTNYSDENGEIDWDCLPTGDYHYVNKGVFTKKMIFVNHICDSCGCKFIDEVDGEKELNGNLFGGIIITLICVFLIFSFICALIVVLEFKKSGITAPWYVFLWAVFSATGAFGALMGSASCFSDI
jgi:hypothetical protein